MTDVDRDADSRAVSVPAQVDLPGDSDREATGDMPPASAEDRSAKDRDHQDAVGSTTDSDPSHVLSKQVEGSAGAEAPRGSRRMIHPEHPLPAGAGRQSFSHGRSKAVVVEKVTRRLLAPSERPGLAAIGSAPDGGEKVQNALSEPAAKNASPGGATAAAPDASTSATSAYASSRVDDEREWRPQRQGARCLQRN